jgi:choline transport protein
MMYERTDQHHATSIVTASIVLLYLSYSVPIACLLLRGRDSIHHGPFWLGRLGLVANVVTLLWTLFTLVMYSFPFVMPARVGTMNYVTVVYGILGMIIAVDWIVRGRKGFRGLRQEEQRVIKSESEG